MARYIEIRRSKSFETPTAYLLIPENHPYPIENNWLALTFSNLLDALSTATSDIIFLKFEFIEFTEDKLKELQAAINKNQSLLAVNFFNCNVPLYRMNQINATLLKNWPPTHSHLFFVESKFWLAERKKCHTHTAEFQQYVSTISFVTKIHELAEQWITMITLLNRILTSVNHRSDIDSLVSASLKVFCYSKLALAYLNIKDHYNACYCASIINLETQHIHELESSLGKALYDGWQAIKGRLSIPPPLHVNKAASPWRNNEVDNHKVISTQIAKEGINNGNKRTNIRPR